MSEKPEDEILRLIRLIDKNKCKLFKGLDAFSGSWLFILGLVLVYITLVVISLIEKTTVSNILTLGFAFVAVAIAGLTLIAQFIERTIVEVNFKRMMKLCCDEGKKLEENEKPLLKALIKIKAKNKEFDLEQIYYLNKPMFNKEKLIEQLFNE